MRGGRIALLVAGVLLALLGLGVALGGGGVLWAYGLQGDDGYVESPVYGLSTDGYAVTGDRIDLRAGPGDWVPWLGEFDVRLEVTPASGEEIFVGIAPAADVERYLDGVAHAEVTRLGRGGDDVRYAERAGGAPDAPGTQDFWTAATVGTGTQELRWTLQPGTWAVVVMNVDGGASVAVEAVAGARVGFLLPLGITMLVGGLLLLAAATAMIVAATAGGIRPGGVRQPPGQPAAPPAAGTGRVAAPASAAPPHGSGPPAGTGYPAVLVGHLDSGLSRWLWLVKWILLIPHFVVLAFLWMAFALLTVVAGFAILFTGRYPRGIFDFNVGVIRWSWRVAFYGYGGLGTDRYPPFSLTAGDYPATFEIAYPQRLSRGLVLVKSWLLAVPHLLVVAVLAGGALSWTAPQVVGQNWQWAVSGGLVGLLVLVAGVAILFTGRYPAGLFDLVMGLNRWIYRVLAYVALMTDEYPPFRLDQGGSDPGAPEPAPAGPVPGSRTATAPPAPAGPANRH